MKYKLIIGWLYPELMNTYGDTGNLIVLKKRCEWRNIDVEIKRLDIGFNYKQLAICDMLFMGGAQDKQQKIVTEDLGKKKKILSKMINEDIPGLYICGAYQFLGEYYKEADGTKIPGLGILDLYTENPGENFPRLIGNIIVKVDMSFDFAQAVRGSEEHSGSRRDDNSNTIIGFENHGGRTYLGRGVKPLGKVIAGFGNNGSDSTEGAIYKNSFGTYLHGPVLPKNPDFADLLIRISLKKKYQSPIDLSPLDNSLETKARETIAKMLGLHI